LSADAREQLRALGYNGPAEATVQDPRSDPTDKRQAFAMYQTAVTLARDRKTPSPAANR
jgi:hypothetical protein